ncbi:Archaeophage PsiM2, terminase large subunit [uncultured Caudovirales phage]|uniref:Archaeophage PsiM2, terminase large subunit n=1 Tax=uncultured Caudovirales phage TaxID=2100421 RepID=A0A6J7WQC5_9CAUD|nr:Archaeophage PsiM2, terminase large subunit [uncultured Caudovirales phage]
MTDIDIRSAAQRLLTLEEASDSFLGYVRLMEPTFELASFHLEIIDVLDRLEKGTLRIADRKVTRVLINMPPRHGKSTLVTHLFSAYYMGRDPRRHVLSTSYSSDLSNTFGQKVRNYVQQPDHTHAFPRFTLRNDTRAKNDWMTQSDATHDGGGSYYGCGVGGSTTGRPANLLLIDDPVKNRAEAESPTYRNRVWDFYVSSLENRKEPTSTGEEPIEIVILTRWHPDDLAGRLMNSPDWSAGRWLHINFPAIREIDTDVKIKRSHLPPDDPDHLKAFECRKLSKPLQFITRKREMALWPDRFSLSELHRKRALNEREFAALYQQSPYIRGGNVLKADWWRYYAPKDIDIEKDFQSIIISVDSAYKSGDQNDPTAIGVFGLHHNADIYILDIFRSRIEYPDLKRKLIALNTQWRGRGLRAIYIEDKSSGQSVIQELRRESGLSIIPHKVSSDKLTRLLTVTPMIQGGRVLLPSQAMWLDIFLQECVEFPNSTHDDQIDMLSMALDVLSRQSVSPDMIDLSMSPFSSLNTLTPKFTDSLRQKLAPNHPTFRGWGQ